MALPFSCIDAKLRDEIWATAGMQQRAKTRANTHTVNILGDNIALNSS
jgi:hypothetical protein